MRDRIGQVTKFRKVGCLDGYAYAANADRIIHQFFSIGPNYSITRYMRDASIEDAKGSSYTHRAITDTMGALAAEGLSRSQAMTVMRNSISRP